jgi:hypothetical protein
LDLQPFEQGEGIRRGPGEARDHVMATGRQAPDLARGALDDGLAEADLAVARRRPLRRFC